MLQGGGWSRPISRQSRLQSVRKRCGGPNKCATSVLADTVRLPAAVVMLMISNLSPLEEIPEIRILTRLERVKIHPTYRPAPAW